MFLVIVDGVFFFWFWGFTNNFSDITLTVKSPYSLFPSKNKKTFYCNENNMFSGILVYLQNCFQINNNICHF